MIIGMVFDFVIVELIDAGILLQKSVSQHVFDVVDDEDEKVEHVNRLGVPMHSPIVFVELTYVYSNKSKQRFIK